jgi:hypothetical protein
MARAFNFRIFAWDAVVEMNGLLIAEIPVPTVIEKLFFEKVSQLILDTCDCNPEYSVEAFDWDWASFRKNILLPNRMHIQSVMQLSDTITDRVVYSIHFCLMNGMVTMKKKMMMMAMLGLNNSFQWKTLTSNVGQ